MTITKKAPATADGLQQREGPRRRDSSNSNDDTVVTHLRKDAHHFTPIEPSPMFHPPLCCLPNTAACGNMCALDLNQTMTTCTVSFNNFKSQSFKLSVSNPKSKHVAYLSLLSQISNCQGLGRKHKLEILKTGHSNSDDSNDDSSNSNDNSSTSNDSNNNSSNHSDNITRRGGPDHPEGKHVSR